MHVLAAVAPLGEEYQNVIKRAFAERWIDLFPSEGKASGAYSEGGAYDVHPYMLINYSDKYTDVSTLAHELGHTMQSYYSNRTQPYPLVNYPTFVAEVASTFNETLLIEYMLANDNIIRDDETRLALLGNYLENIKATVFRQAQFAEFELRMHEMAHKGEPITGDSLSKLYMDITKKYYGHDQGISDRRRLHRERVELHPALLSRFLRLSVRDVVHGVGRARGEGHERGRGSEAQVPRVLERGRFQVSD